MSFSVPFVWNLTFWTVWSRSFRVSSRIRWFWVACPFKFLNYIHNSLVDLFEAILLLLSHFPVWSVVISHQTRLLCWFDFHSLLKHRLHFPFDQSGCALTCLLFIPKIKKQSHSYSIQKWKHVCISRFSMIRNWKAKFKSFIFHHSSCEISGTRCIMFPIDWITCLHYCSCIFLLLSSFASKWIPYPHLGSCSSKGMVFCSFSCILDIIEIHSVRPWNRNLSQA